MFPLETLGASYFYYFNMVARPTDYFFKETVPRANLCIVLFFNLASTASIVIII